MTLFLTLASIVFIVLLYLSFKSLKDLLRSKKEYQKAISLQNYSHQLGDNTKSGIFISEISEIESQDAREALLNNLPFATFVFSNITGRTKFINTAYEKLLGYTLTEIPTVFKCMEMLIPDKNYRNNIKLELSKICKENKKKRSIFRTLEVHVSCKDGSQKSISLGCISKGNLKWYYGYDLANIQQKEDQLLHGENQFQEIDASKNKIFSIIAHDLRSPFNTILGCSDLLVHSIEEMKTEEVYMFLKIINSTAKNSLALLDNLLNWTKLQMHQINFNPQTITVSSVINEIVELFNSAAIIKEIQLVYLKSDDFEICTDINMLKTVLRNTVSNAIKFTGAGGKISILAKKEQDKAEITISDSGIGISEITVNKLFHIETNKWTHGTAKEQGSGLGLPLCNELMLKLGGSISVKSEEGIGSEFKLTLPITSQV